MADYQAPDHDERHVHPFERERYWVDPATNPKSSADIAHDLIEFMLTNHPPAGIHVIERFERIREAAKHLAHEIIDCVPLASFAEHDRDKALDHLRQAVMFAVAAVATNQHAIPTDVAIEVDDSVTHGGES